MHELPFVESILSLTLEHAQKGHAKRVVALNLVIGDMASIVDNTIQFYWDQLSEGTIAAGAVLQFNRIPAVFYCWNCGTTYQLKESNLVCPTCGGSKVSLVRGNEFRLESIDIEGEEEIANEQRNV